MSRHTARARAGQDRASLYDEITDKIIAELEAGRVPWVQPWGTAAAKAPLAMPKNAATGAAYSRDQRADPLGRRDRARLPRPELAHLSPGARRSAAMSARASTARPSSMPTASSPTTRRRRAAETGEEAQAIPFLKRFTVFNTDQCEGLPEEIAAAAPPPPAGPDRAQSRGADRGDRRRLPHRRQPRLLHATGTITCRCRRRKPISSRSIGTGPRSMSSVTRPAIAHRLNRDLSGSFGSKQYALRRAGRRNDARLLLRLARHRADRAPCRLHRLLARGAARGQSRHRPRRLAGEQGGRLSCSPFCRPTIDAAVDGERGGRVMHPQRGVSARAFSRCRASERKRAAPVFVTGWRPRESLSAARRGESDMALPFRRSPFSPRATFPSTSWC